MKNYFSIIPFEVQRQITFRFNIASYVVANIIELFAQVLIWNIIYYSVDSIKGYSYQEMISYVVIGWIFSFMTQNYSYEKLVARHISDGTLSNFIVRPISYLKFTTVQCLGRTVIAFGFVILQSLLYLLIFHADILIPDNFWVYPIFLGMIILAYFIKFLFSVLIGLSAFWLIEIEGIFYSYEIFSNFMSGNYFPISILPAAMLNASMILPFVYTFFVPIQLFLGKMTLIQGLKGLMMQAVWLFIIVLTIKIVWHFGLRKYESVGI